MKKLFLGLAIGLGLLCSGTVAHAVDVNNFTITNFDVQMTLGRDSENRSTLKTVETITAQFPETDQNHGLERAFVKEYNGHPTSLQVQSVTDTKGSSLAYHWSGDTIRIGDANTYVHGLQTYVITYTQRDVTRYYADTGKDEFYWDVIGTDWRVPILGASVEVSIANDIVAKHTDNAYCYRGVSGSKETCTISPIETLAAGDGLTYKAEAENIGNGKGVTIALGFDKGTFAVYQQSLMERLAAIWGIILIVTSVAGVVLIAWFAMRWYSVTNRKKELGTIVPEYLPPKNVSVTTSARIGGYTTSVMAAQLLDLAVRHYIKIYEVKEKTLFTPGQYEIEVIRDVSDLTWEERELLSDTFGAMPSVGSRLNLKSLKNNPGYFQRTLNNDNDLNKLIRGTYGLRMADEGLKKWLRKAALVTIVFAVVTMSILLATAALVAFILSFVAWSLTDEGLALKRYLEGLKMYIKVAETERIKMLQSPEGAEKVASVASGTDSAQLVKLYERVLPYAVLFGQEKEWNKQLGSYYETVGTQPDWYSGQSAVFNAAVFSSAMNSFSTTAASSSSSSTGGSSGGGSSGGGGGGGGGGGW